MEFWIRLKNLGHNLFFGLVVSIFHVTDCVEMLACEMVFGVEMRAIGEVIWHWFRVQPVRVSVEFNCDVGGL